jgi:hypothetical protein
MRGAIPLPPQYAFMTWYPVKKSTGTTLRLPLPLQSEEPEIREKPVIGSSTDHCVYEEKYPTDGTVAEEPTEFYSYGTKNNSRDKKTLKREF